MLPRLARAALAVAALTALSFGTVAFGAPARGHAPTAPMPGMDHPMDQPMADGLAAAATTGTVPAPTACGDASYTLEGFHVEAALAFNYNPAGAPASVARTAVDAFRYATATVTVGANRCQAARRRNGAASYAGTTSRKPQLDAAGHCTGNDGHNTIGWGSLPRGYLAITCVYYAGSVVTDADIMINTSMRWFTALPAGCAGQYDLQSVLTHEQGHTFGLGHVDPATHAGQTMTTSLAPCDIRKRLLGLGDYRGLAKLYS